MLNIGLLLIIVLIILSVAAVNFLSVEAPSVYGNFGIGTRVTIRFCSVSHFMYLYVLLDRFPSICPSIHHASRPTV